RAPGGRRGDERRRHALLGQSPAARPRGAAGARPRRDRRAGVPGAAGGPVRALAAAADPGMTAPFEGVVVPLVTPLDANGDVSAAGVERLVGSVRDHAAALMPALSSGEGWRLSEDQWRAMVSRTVAAARGLPVFAGL